MTSSLENPAPEQNHLEITSSRQFPVWLAEQGISRLSPNWWGKL